MTNRLEDSDEWMEKIPEESSSVVSMYYNEKKPLLLRIDRIEELDGVYYRTVLKVSHDHEEYAHRNLFETPILDSEEDAMDFAEAIAVAPMRYGRKFFKMGKVGK